MTTVLWATGFEAGTTSIFDPATTSVVTIGSGGARTGTYYLTRPYNASFAYAQADITAVSELYVSIAINHIDSSPTRNFQLKLRNGTTDLVVVKRDDTTGYYDVYVGAGEVAAGTIYVPTGIWNHLQVHVVIDDSSGVIQTKVDGVDDVDYSGDTKPGSATTVDNVQFYWSEWIGQRIDDVAIGTGDWLWDVRADKVVPSADVTTEWTPSSGSVHWSLIDEVPPSDGDYVSSGSHGDIDKYGHGGWSGSGKTPLAVVLWTRTFKDVADTHELIQFIESDGERGDSPAKALTTTARNYGEVWNLDPSAGSPAWTEEAIDDLYFGHIVNVP